MHETHNRPGCFCLSWLDNSVIPFMQRHGYTAGRANLSGLFLSLFIPLGFYSHEFWGFLLLLLCVLFYTAAEGMAADADSDPSRGEFFPGLARRASSFAVWAGLWVLFYKNGAWIPEATLGIFLALTLVVLSDYASLLVRSRGCPDSSGIMNTPGQALYFLIWTLLLLLFAGAEGLLWAGLLVFIAFMLVNLIQKWAFVQKKL